MKHQRMSQKLLFKENISIFTLRTIYTKQARELRCGGKCKLSATATSPNTYQRNQYVHTSTLAPSMNAQTSIPTN